MSHLVAGGCQQPANSHRRGEQEQLSRRVILKEKGEVSHRQRFLTVLSGLETPLGLQEGASLKGSVQWNRAGR